MGDIKQDISVNDRSFQDKNKNYFLKKRVIWCHKGHRRLDYLAIIIERWFTKIGRNTDDLEMMTHMLSNLPEEY